MLYKLTCHTPIGKVCALSDLDSLVRVYVDGEGDSIDYSLELLSESYAPPTLFEFRRWIYDYFAERRPDPHAISISPEGSDFKIAVWREILEIPYGAVMGLGELSERVSLRLCKKNMPRHVISAAVLQNPLPILVPCHRVVSDEGGLLGNALRLKRQARLLRLECARGAFAPRGIPVLEKRAFMSR